MNRMIKSLKRSILKSQKEISKSRSLFFWRKNLEERVMLDFNKIKVKNKRRIK